MGWKLLSIALYSLLSFNAFSAPNYFSCEQRQYVPARSVLYLATDLNNQPISIPEVSKGTARLNYFLNYPSSHEVSYKAETETLRSVYLSFQMHPGFWNLLDVKVEAYGIGLTAERYVTDVPNLRVRDSKNKCVDEKLSFESTAYYASGDGKHKTYAECETARTVSFDNPRQDHRSAHIFSACTKSLNGKGYGVLTLTAIAN